MKNLFKLSLNKAVVFFPDYFFYSYYFVYNFISKLYKVK